VLEAAAAELATGCETDADCTAQVPFVCAWNCGAPPLFVSNEHEAAYAAVLQEAQEACTTGAGGEMCPIPPCDPRSTPAAMCQAGTCVQRSSEALAEDIEDELDRLNQCETIEDCEPVAYPFCSTRYIAKGSDRTQLDTWLSAYNESLGEVGCDGSCACGVLQCEEQRCTTTASNCMDVPEGGMNICL
jgi:hypothetical protein